MFEKLFKPAFTSETEAAQAKEAERHQQLQFELEQIKNLNDKDGDQEQLCQAAIKAAFTQARQIAARKLQNEAALHTVEKESSDKSVQHIVREKIKQIKLEQQEKTQAQTDIEELCGKLEHLVKANSSPLFKPQFEHLCSSWKMLSTSFHELAKQICQTRYDQAATAGQAILTALEEEANKLAEAHRADAEAQAEVQAQTQQKNLDEQAAKETQEQNNSSKEDEQKKAATAKEEHKKQQALLERSLLEQITAVEKNLEQGIVANISKKISAVQKKLDSLDAPLAKHHEGKVQLLKNRLNELRDWQSFAALPKKQELCEKMQRLADSPLEAQEQSKAIQTLQHEWRDLKGTGNEEEQKLWDTFKEISDKAYEGCKQFFDMQKNVRTENLKQREKVCEELEQFNAGYDWSSPDWKAVDKIIEAAKNEFFRLSPIDHKKLEAIKKRYADAVNPLIDKLRPEQKKNEADRQNLIDTAKKLATQDDTQGAIAQAKQLQQQWKEIGITRPRENQKLWQQFRDACDAIFSKRNTERDQFKEQLGQDLKNAENICIEIEKLAAQSDDALQNSKQQYQEFRQTFLGMNQLQKDKQKRLFSRFYQACDKYQDQVTGIKKRRQNASMVEAFRKASLCDQLENGADAASIAAQWESDAAVPADIAEYLNKRHEVALKISSGEMKIDFTTNEKQRRLILVQLEILLDKQTPAEDKGLRMEYQLQQLSNKGLTSKTLDKKEQVKELTLKWIGSHASRNASLADLQKRFETLINN